MTSLPYRNPTTTDGRYASGRRSPLPLVLLMGVTLVSASLLRQFGLGRADTAAATGASFRQFNSYTLGLLLGGLRGPLVMTLWSTSETQKSERNLEDINTKIELIRLLQPEFDTVHLFQIWNKAYNLSVQMANLPSKYATILDAIDYANNTRAEHPEAGNINLESSLAGVYFDKLGNASEKAYYRERLREETRVPEGQTKIVFPQARRDEFVRTALAAGADARRYTIRPESGAPGQLSVRLQQTYADRVLKQFQGGDVKTEVFPARKVQGTTIRNEHDTMLDAQGRIAENLVRRDRATDVPDTQWRPQDGELAYLTRFEPFPHGLSPFALAYDYYKRSLALQVDKKQVHAQLSDRVVSSRPALALKNWSEEEMERGRHAEMAQFGLPPTPEQQSPLPLELPAAQLPIDQPVALTPLLEEAIYCYDRAADIGTAALAEYRAHIDRYKDDNATYRSHLAHAMAILELTRADARYLQAMTSTGEARTRAAREAAVHYNKAIDLLARNVLAFFITDEMAAALYPQGYGKTDVMNSFENPSAFPEGLVPQTFGRVLAELQRQEGLAGSDVDEYRTYAARAQARLERLRPVLGNQ